MAQTANAARMNRAITLHNRLVAGHPPEGIPDARLDPPARSIEEWRARVNNGWSLEEWRAHNPETA